MAQDLDPHSLVALMSHVFSGKQCRAPHLSAPRSQDNRYGLRAEPNTNGRTSSILDAIASIAVSKAKSQVVAIAIQLNSETREIRLTVAENRAVEDSLIGHLAS